jgi:hypothetical protein
MENAKRQDPEPVGDWVNTGAGGENEVGNASTGGNPGDGANDITRAGFPNADPDGYDDQRSDLQGIDIGEKPAPTEE